MTVSPVVRLECCLDPTDIENVYRRYAIRCHRLAVHIVRDPHLAEDVVQEVFATVVCEAHRFDPSRGSLATWLMTLTHHKAVDLVRSRTRRAGADQHEALGAAVADPRPLPDEQVCRDDEGLRVRAALQKLRRPEREVILLAYFEGYSQSQIAALTDVPLGTVKSRTLRALRQLSEAMA